MAPTGWSVAETIAREAYGRLVALLAARTGDLAGAEDALADALLKALECWPRDGTPANPQAWLLTVARRRRIDARRRRAHAQDAQSELLRIHEARGNDVESALPDARLGLMLACAHPAIDAGAHTPLMLQAVLGLTAERMASAFLVSPAAMTKRLVRAKTKLAATGVRFELPEADVLAARLEQVLDAVYAAFTLGRDDMRDGNGLAGEALWLGRLLSQLTPGEPEAAGLLSLMLFVTARRRPDAAAYIPLSAQDPAGWDDARLTEAEALLRAAGRLAQPGRFQLEAAIQAVHADRRRSGRTDWAAIILLYDGLIALAPMIGAQVGRAAALAQAGDPRAALVELDAIEPRRVAAHQAYWATRAHVLAVTDRAAEASDAYLRAAGLTEMPAVRAWLLGRRASLAQ